MTGTERRIERLETAVGTEGMEEYRRTVMCLLEIGAIDPPDDPDDIEGLILRYAEEGRTLRGILDEIDGTSRGLPDPNELI